MNTYKPKMGYRSFYDQICFFVIIVNAGKEAFEGMEPSVVVFSGSEMELISFSDNEFVGSNMHDILVTDKFPEAIWTVKSKFCGTSAY